MIFSAAATPLSELALSDKQIAVLQALYEAAGTESEGCAPHWKIPEYMPSEILDSLWSGMGYVARERSVASIMGRLHAERLVRFRLFRYTQPPYSTVRYWNVADRGLRVLGRDPSEA